MFKDKRILITGHLGMIGSELWDLLDDQGAILFGADLKNGIDLKSFDKCLEITQNIDYCFLVHGIKGNPRKTAERPLDFFVPMVMASTNMIEACRVNDVKRILYTSSIAVEHPETDEFPSWAKLTGEKQLEAMRIQYPKGSESCTVRPCNVYGPEDDFDNPDAMVITSLVRKAFEGNKLKVWGNGEAVRDFIHARDVAKGMMKCMEVMPDIPINLCSGKGIPIKKIAEIIAIIKRLEIEYDETKPTGAKSRVMKYNGDIIGWEPEIGIEDGIKEVLAEAEKKLGRERK